MLTDPPFNESIDYGDHYNDDRPQDEYLVECGTWLSEIYLALKPSGLLLLFSTDLLMFDFYKIAVSVGFKPISVIIWDKMFTRKFAPNLPLPMYEPCVVYLKPGEDTHTYNPGHVGANIVRVMRTTKEAPEARGIEHRCMRPVELYRRLILAFSNPGDVVYDPFLGTGTTLRACIDTGRVGIGHELDPRADEYIPVRIMEDIPRLESYDGDEVEEAG